jgi:GDSL-like Lipase/Acylhydrolase
MLETVARHWKDALLAVCSLLFSYLCLEIAYRIYQHQTLPEKISKIVAQVGSTGVSPLYRFDKYTGYRYAANVEAERGTPWLSHWRTNSHGHVSDDEYPERKPPGEYRIAVFGDSFTANITNNVRWTEVLERQLNASMRWKASVEGRYTRVLNFAMDGTGLVQFAAMLQHYGLKFEPDLVLVNFISDDILRRLHFPTPPPSTGDRDADIRIYVTENYINDINWFRAYPELFAATIGRYWKMSCGLPLEAAVVMATRAQTRYMDRREAVRDGVAALREMAALSPRIMFFEQPLYYDLINATYPDIANLSEEFHAAAAGLNIVDMKPRMEALLAAKPKIDPVPLAGLNHQQIASLAIEQQPEIYRWFFVPDDVHYTDYGTTLYAHEVGNYLIETAFGVSRIIGKQSED